MFFFIEKLVRRSLSGSFFVTQWRGKAFEDLFKMIITHISRGLFKIVLMIQTWFCSLLKTRWRLMSYEGLYYIETEHTIHQKNNLSFFIIQAIKSSLCISVSIFHIKLFSIFCMLSISLIYFRDPSHQIKLYIFNRRLNTWQERLYII